MRMLLKASIPVEAGNKAIADGSLGKTMQDEIERLKPEAVYFTAENGFRTVLIFFDMKESSQIPAAAEPLFMKLNAQLDFFPVMNPEELMKGLEKIPKG